MSTLTQKQKDTRNAKARAKRAQAKAAKLATSKASQTNTGVVLVQRAYPTSTNREPLTVVKRLPVATKRVLVGEIVNNTQVSLPIYGHRENKDGTHSYILHAAREGYTQFNVAGYKNTIYASYTFAACLASGACGIDSNNKVIKSNRPYNHSLFSYLVSSSALRYWSKTKPWLDTNSGLTDEGRIKMQSRINGNDKGYIPAPSLTQAFLVAFRHGSTIRFSDILKGAPQDLIVSFESKGREFTL